MKFVISIVFYVFLNFVFAQTNSKILKKEQQNLEKRITNTKSLLKKVKNNSQNSLNALRLIDIQIRNREELLTIFDDQVRMAEIAMKEKKQTIQRLKLRIEKLKKQYKLMVLYAFKHRNNNSNIMYLLSAKNYNEANKRNSYLKRVAEMQKKQVVIIRQNKKIIGDEINNIAKSKEEKLTVIEEKKAEKKLIEIDKSVKEITISKYKNEEKKLSLQLQEDETKKQNLKQKIAQAIRKEILDEQKKQQELALKEKAKNEKIAREKEEKAKKDKEVTDKKNKENLENEVKPTTSTEKTIEKKKETVYISNTEDATVIALDKNFISNRGKLPSPVINGSIVERYGKNPHPTLDGVTTNNNGIDISCSGGSNVRAIFTGEVSSIFSISGAGKVIIIKHGNYRSVYSNIQESYVSVGAKVSVRQNIGSLIKEGGISICHFEIHQVINGVTQSLNPSLWISK